VYRDIEYEKLLSMKFFTFPYAPSLFPNLTVKLALFFERWYNKKTLFPIDSLILPGLCGGSLAGQGI
jgi:hypothetical protein